MLIDHTCNNSFKKTNCYVCDEKIIFDSNNNNLFLLASKNIKLSDIYQICDECFYNESYIDLIKILDQYDINFADFFFKIFLYRNKFYVLSYEWKDYLKNNLRKLNENKRKNELSIILKEKKLNNIKCNLCNAYIKYGQPSLEFVVSNIEKMQDEKINRLYSLVKKLKKCGKQYDDKIPIYNKYIKFGGNINKIIKESDLESQFVHNTKYLYYLQHNDINTARYLASIEFVNNGNSHELVNQYITKKNTIVFY